MCTMEYYSTIKKNIYESVLMRWMLLEPIIQSEVYKKVIYIYIYESEVIKKNTNTVY